MSPSYNGAALTFRPLRNVPLVLPRSTSWKRPSPSDTTFACLREMPSSSTWNWASTLRPSTVSDLSSLNIRPIPAADFALMTMRYALCCWGASPSRSEIEWTAVFSSDIVTPILWVDDC